MLRKPKPARPGVQPQAIILYRHHQSSIGLPRTDLHLPGAGVPDNVGQRLVDDSHYMIRAGRSKRIMRRQIEIEGDIHKRTETGVFCEMAKSNPKRPL